jgi:hypothetical protein
MGMPLKSNPINHVIHAIPQYINKLPLIYLVILNPLSFSPKGEMFTPSPLGEDWDGGLRCESNNNYPLNENIENFKKIPL